MGTLDCGVFEKRSGDSAEPPRGPVKVMARLGGGLAVAAGLLVGALALSGRMTCVTT
jgi:sugar/nucleoside kinase (ribokinase family)